MQASRPKIIRRHGFGDATIPEWRSWAADRVAGAQTSAARYGLVESAKPDGFDLYTYLRRLFERQRHACTFGVVAHERTRRELSRARFPDCSRSKEIGRHIAGSSSVA